MRLTKFVTAATLVLGFALPSHAANIMITVNGTVDTADPGMGYTAGDPVSFTWVVNDYAPATPVGSGGSSFSWKEETAGSDPVLWANVYGTGIGGTFNAAPGSAPFERLEARDIASSENFVLRMDTDSFNVTTNNHGIHLNENSSYMITSLIFSARGIVPFADFSSTLPNPTEYLANYVGTYSANPSDRFDLIARNAADSNLKAYFDPTSVTIAPVPVPEPSTYALGALAAGVMAFIARRRKAKRQA